MPTVRVLSRKAFTHGGRPIAAGQFLTLSPIDAAVLSRQGLVNISKNPDQPVSRKDMVAEEPKRRRRSASVAKDEPRRRYRRRDMTPEGE
jgi:hypothetical protein